MLPNFFLFALTALVAKSRKVREGKIHSIIEHKIPFVTRVSFSALDFNLRAREGQSLTH